MGQREKHIVKQSLWCYPLTEGLILLEGKVCHSHFSFLSKWGKKEKGGKKA